jgi:integrase
MLQKRGKIWHCDFVADGVRYRQSLKTTDWRVAQRKESDLKKEADAGKVATDSKRKSLVRLAFKDAAERFIADRAPNWAPLTVRTERERARAVSLVLGLRTVSSLTPDDVLDYVRQRKAAGKSNATVNRELDVIRGVLKKAKRWHRFADVRPLRVTENIGRALQHGEKLRLLRVAMSRPGWQSAYYASVLAFNTTCRGCELKGLQWCDVDLINRAITIRRSKTEAGLRVIPLNADAFTAITALYRRAQQLGPLEPSHYVFFSCERGAIDPTRSQKSWRTAWRNLREAAGLPTLRFHDIRHHAITELAESQTSDQTIMSIAGHVSTKMLQHYSHIRLAAKRTALDGLSMGRAGYDTNHVTKRPEAADADSQVIENMVELVGIEPTTSSLRTMRSPS